MDQQLRRQLERAAGEDPHVDLTERVWLEGRQVRRRRHAVQALGGVVAAGALVGAFAIGGGTLSSPTTYDGPARPTRDDTATVSSLLRTEDPVTAPTSSATTGPMETGQTSRTSRTGEGAGREPAAGKVQEPTRPAGTAAADSSGAQDGPAAGPGTTSPSGAPATPSDDGAGPTPTHPADGVLALGAADLDGLPLGGPPADLVAAAEAELGAAGSVVHGAVDCAGTAGADVYEWDTGFLLVTRGTSGASWSVHRADPVLLLPDGLRIGMPEADVRSSQQVDEETRDGAGRTVLVLASGLAVTIDPQTGLVATVDSQPTQTC